MKNCETCLWGCFEMESSDDMEVCEFYYSDENESLDEEYIENMREKFLEEWDEYLSEWNN